jgi:enamine deaminase RidA (YjgF/YER057c/UK114 family)
MTDEDPMTNAETSGSLSPEARLLAAGIAIPALRAPIGRFVGAVSLGELLFLSGQGPVTAEVRHRGKVGRDVSVEQAYRHARLVGLNLLANARAALGSLDRVSRIVKVFGMVNAVEDFEAHPAVINGCSDLFLEVFGPEAGAHARSAVGVASLPGGISVEIEAVFAINLTASASCDF